MANPVGYPGPEWETASPLELGLDGSALASAGQVLSQPGSNACAFLVIRFGKIAWEQYYQGFDVEDRLHLFSVTKSFLSALVGIALHEGYLENLDQPISHFFPEVTFPPASLQTAVTLRHHLTMTSGLLWPLGGWGREPMVERMRHSLDWAQYILSLPIRRAEMGRFHYCSASSHLLSTILTKATGQSACEYARDRLFTPLGILNVNPGTDWETDPQNNSLGGWGLHLTARDVARFGWLYVCGGQWQNQTIIPASWVTESTQPAGTSSNVYGYHWWLRKADGHQAFSGLGSGGQYLFCVPGQQLVVVILSRHVQRWPDRWELLKEILTTSLLHQAGS